MESPVETQQRVQRTQFVKAKDLAAAGLPTWEQANGIVQPVTDPTGAPLTHYDHSSGIAYDSSGAPQKVGYDGSGQPVLSDPLANAASVSAKNPDTGLYDKYRVAPGLPWQYDQPDEQKNAAILAGLRRQATNAAATALGRQLTSDEGQIVKESAVVKAQKKRLLADVPIDPALLGEDPKAVEGDPAQVHAAIDQHFNDEYGSPAANEKSSWLGSDLSQQAQALRAQLDTAKAQAHARADDLFARQAQINQKISVRQQQADMEASLRQKQLRDAAANAGLVIPGLDDNQQASALPEQSSTPPSIPGQQPIAQNSSSPNSTPAAPEVPPIPGIDSQAPQPSAPKAEGALQSAARQVLSNIVPAAATAAGGAVGATVGGVAGLEGGPLAIGASIAGGLAGAIGGAALGKKVQDHFMGGEWTKANQAQLDANMAEHPIASKIGAFVPAVVSMLGGGGAQMEKAAAGYLERIAQSGATPSFMQKAIASLPENMIIGARMGVGAAAQNLAEGKGNATDLLNDGVKGAVTMGPVAFVPGASTLLGAALGKAPSDAAVLATANALYDRATKDTPIDFGQLAKDIGTDIPGFALFNLLAGLTHSHPIFRPPPEGSSGQPARPASPEPSGPTSSSTAPEIQPEPTTPEKTTAPVEANEIPSPAPEVPAAIPPETTQPPAPAGTPPESTVPAGMTNFGDALDRAQAAAEATPISSAAEAPTPTAPAPKAPVAEEPVSTPSVEPAATPAQPTGTTEPSVVPESVVQKAARFGGEYSGWSGVGDNGSAIIRLPDGTKKMVPKNEWEPPESTGTGNSTAGVEKNVKDLLMYAQGDHEKATAMADKYATTSKDPFTKQTMQAAAQELRRQAPVREVPGLEPAVEEKQVAPQAGEKGASAEEERPAPEIPGIPNAEPAEKEVPKPKAKAAKKTAPVESSAPKERIQLRTGPQTYTVEEKLAPQKGDQPGEQYYRVRNERTGAEQTVEQADMKPVGGKTKETIQNENQRNSRVSEKQSGPTDQRRESSGIIKANESAGESTSGKSDAPAGLYTADRIRELVSRKSATGKSIGLEIREREPDEPHHGGGWYDVNKNQVVISPDKFAETANQVADRGGDADKFVRLAMTEEESHWRDFGASKLEGHANGEFQSKAFDAAPSELKRALLSTYPTTDKAIAGAELIRMLDQLSHDGGFTEESAPWLNSKPLRDELEKWEVPAEIINHLNRMAKLGERPRASIRGNPLDRVAPHAETKAFVDEMARHTPGIDVEVLHNETELPEEVRSKLSGDRHEGIFDPAGKKVYLFTDNLDSAQRAGEVFAHEVFGHYGIDKVVGDKDWKGITDSVLSEPTAQRTLRTIAAEYHGTADVIGLTDAQRDNVAREYMARLAEKPEMNPGLWKSILLAVKKALRRMGIRKNWSLDELNDLVRQSIQSVREEPHHSGRQVRAEDGRFNGPPLEPRASLWSDVRKKAENEILAGKHEWNALGTKADIAGGHDAVTNIAKMAGEQIGNRMKLAVPDATDRAAMPFIIEAGGDPSKLADMRQQISTSTDTANAKKYLPVIDHAIANAPRLEPARAIHDQAMTDSLAELKSHGVEVGEVENYVTRSLEAPDAIKDMLPNLLFSMGQGGGNSPRYFTKERAFATLADAIHAGYKPKSTDFADLDQHRIEAGARIIEQKKFLNEVKRTPAPQDGKPIIGELEQRNTLAFQQRVLDWNANGQKGPYPKPEMSVPRGYTMVQVGGAPIPIHNQFSGLFRDLYGRSAVRDITAGRALLKAAALAKSGTLVLDTFHVGRMLFKMATGGGGLPLTMREGRPAFNIHNGRAALEYADPDLATAVAQGHITQKEADYAKSIRPKLDRLMRHGLNVGSVSDNLMEQARLHIPLMSDLNSWIFQKLSRSAMAQTAMTMLDRNLASPRFAGDETGAYRQTAREANEMFGNLQNQGLFKSKTLQDVARLIFLAPNWTESQARYEGRAYGQMAKGVGNLARGQSPAFGNASRAFAAGFTALLAANQVINYLSRGQSTFQNPEQNHQLDAWIPGGKRGSWYNPFSVVGEYASAAYKYVQQHENPVDVATHIVSNKLSPLARGLKEGATGRDYAGRPFDNNTDRFRSAITSGLPSPIPLGALVEKDPRAPLGYRLNRQPASVEKQALQATGMKVTPVQSPISATYALAQPFREDKSGHEFGEYTQLRQALDNSDARGAKAEIQWLMQRGKSTDEILHSAGIRKDGSVAPQTFTGNPERERAFVRSLSPANRTTYSAAQRDRISNAQFLKTLMPSQRVNKPSLNRSLVDLPR